MDLLYVYDDKIACDRDGNYYTGSAFSQEIFDRYLAQFDTLTLLMRRAPVSPDDMQTLARMNRLTDARIRVVFYPDRRESLRAFFNAVGRSGRSSRAASRPSARSSSACRRNLGRSRRAFAAGSESRFWPRPSAARGTA